MKVTHPLSAVFLPTVGLLPAAFSLDAHALDAHQQNACTHQLAGKCFHTGNISFNPSLIRTPTDAASFCAGQKNYCSPQECAARVEVLAGRVPGETKGNPCLPAGSSPGKK